MKKLVFLALPLLVLAFAIAAPTGANVQTGTQETAPSQTAGTLTTEGGNITNVNVSGYTITDKWAGFWGEVSGDIRLADASNNIFYQWSISDPTGGIVYATTGSISDWSCTNIVPIQANDAIFVGSALIEGTDSFNNTFINQESTSIPLACAAQSFNYTTTWQAGSQGTAFKTYAAKASAESEFIWAGRISADQTSFKGGTITADYQILAGVKDPTLTQTFYFYLELP